MANKKQRILDIATNKWCLICAVLILAGCQPRPVLNIVAEPIVTGSHNDPAIEDVQRLIRKSVMQKTWIIDKIDPGTIDAHLIKRNGVARITIKFTTKEYDIRYVSSEGLQYDGTRIFHRYSSWIKGLQQTINNNLMTL